MRTQPFPSSPAALRVLALAVGLALALVLAACADDEAGDEPLALALADKTRVKIDAEFGTTKVPLAGRQELWVNQSSGWDPCPEVLGTEFPPDTCWIRVVIDETQVAVLLPEPNGTLGPYPVSVHFDVFDFEPGEHYFWLVQVGRLELRETEQFPFQLEAPPAEGSA